MKDDIIAAVFLAVVVIAVVWLDRRMTAHQARLLQGYERFYDKTTRTA